MAEAARLYALPEAVAARVEQQRLKTQNEIDFDQYCAEYKASLEEECLACKDEDSGRHTNSESCTEAQLSKCFNLLPAEYRSIENPSTWIKELLIERRARVLVILRREQESKTGNTISDTAEQYGDGENKGAGGGKADEDEGEAGGGGDTGATLRAQLSGALGKFAMVCPGSQEALRSDAMILEWRGNEDIAVGETDWEKFVRLNGAYQQVTEEVILPPLRKLFEGSNWGALINSNLDHDGTPTWLIGTHPVWTGRGGKRGMRDVFSETLNLEFLEHGHMLELCSDKSSECEAKNRMNEHVRHDNRYTYQTRVLGTILNTCYTVELILKALTYTISITNFPLVPQRAIRPIATD